jgi:hypothetical protein
MLAENKLILKILHDFKFYSLTVFLLNHRSLLIITKDVYYFYFRLSGLKKY